MPSYDQLLDVAHRLVNFINDKEADDTKLSKICDQDVVVPIPYLGSTPDFAGLVGVTQKIHKSSPDFVMGFKESIVDEKQGRVVFLLEPSGTQTGEWLGIPGSGKPFKTQGFFYAKVNPATGLISEFSMIFQDLLFLQQVGVLPPMGPGA